MKLKIEIDAIRWDDTLETYEQLRFLVAPQGIVRNPQNRSQLLLGAVDTKWVTLGDWVIQLPGQINLVLAHEDATRLIKNRETD